MAPQHRFLVAAALAAALLASACSSSGGEAVDRTVDVFAASSLTDAFEEIGTAFTDAHPGTEVRFNFAASSELAAQIVEGAPADVFASADAKNMAKVVYAGANGGDPAVFATNSMSIVVAPGNPSGIASLADLADADLVVVLCAAEVPCGRYATDVLQRAGVSVTPRSFEQNARAAVAKVVAGEADAAIVFSTDVLAAGDSATGVEIAPEANVVAEYPIATVGPASTAASDFVEFVRSAEGRRILEAHGFGAP